MGFAVGAATGLRSAVGAAVGLRAAIGAAIGLSGAVVGVPLILGAVGFTAVGIAAGSLAAKMMSATAIAYGGGVPSGSLVAIGQSIGATGLSCAAKTAMMSIGAAVGLLV